MIDTNKLTELAKKCIPSCSDWDADYLQQWLNWHDATGTLFYCHDENDEPLGFAVIRPIASLQNKHQRFHVNPRGRTLYCDMAYAPSLPIMRQLAIGMLQQFGPRDYFASTRNEKIHVRPLEKIIRALFRK